MVLSEDQERTVCATLKHVYQQFSADYNIAFANCGDQNNKSSPKVPVCQELGIELIDGLGDRLQSLSWLFTK